MAEKSSMSISEPVFDPDLQQQIERSGVIAVLVIDDARDAVPLARALLDGGVDIMELTLRTPAALAALREIRTHVPEMLAGIGTVLTAQQIDQVAGADAAFAVAPGTNPQVVKAAIHAGLSFAPGVATASDIEQSLACGCRLLKLFPSEPLGGIAYLKSMAAPYAHLGLRYVPLGGLNVENMQQYLQDPIVAAVGGSWLATRDLIQGHKWADITQRAKACRDLAAQAGREGR